MPEEIKPGEVQVRTSRLDAVEDQTPGPGEVQVRIGRLDTAKGLTPEPKEVKPKEVQVYCAKCKDQRVLKGFDLTEAAGRLVVKGVCPVCKAQITHFVEKNRLSKLGMGHPVE
jgi:hypothetical protein